MHDVRFMEKPDSNDNVNKATREVHGMGRQKSTEADEWCEC